MNIRATLLCTGALVLATLPVAARGSISTTLTVVNQSKVTCCVNGAKGSTVNGQNCISPGKTVQLEVSYEESNQNSKWLVQCNNDAPDWEVDKSHAWSTKYIGVSKSTYKLVIPQGYDFTAAGRIQISDN